MFSLAGTEGVFASSTSMYGLDDAARGKQIMAGWPWEGISFFGLFVITWDVLYGVAFGTIGIMAVIVGVVVYKKKANERV